MRFLSMYFAHLFYHDPIVPLLEQIGSGPGRLFNIAKRCKILMKDGYRFLVEQTCGIRRLRVGTKLHYRCHGAPLMCRTFDGKDSRPLVGTRRQEDTSCWLKDSTYAYAL